MMSPKVLRVLAFLFLIAGVAVAILNLKRVAGLGLVGLPPFFIVLGAGLMAASKRRQREKA